MVEVTGSDERSSLFRRGIYYDRKKFYSPEPNDVKLFTVVIYECLNLAIAFPA